MPHTTSLWHRIEKAIIRGLVSLIARFYLRRPDQTEIIAIKIPTFKVAFYAFMNELSYLLGRPAGYRLYTLNLEVTNACNLSCEMCPVNHGMMRAKGLMDFNLFTKIIDETPLLEFVLVFQWGEPLLHPRLFEMIDYAYMRGIRTMITSNGALLTDEMIGRILGSRLERITFSVDGTSETHTQIRGFPYETLKKSILSLKAERDRRESTLKIDTSMVVWDKTEPHVEAYLAEWTPIADRVQLVPRLAEIARRNRCRELWRGQLVVFWDGRVSACCVDYDGQLILGDANHERIQDIWNGPKMRALRRAHVKRRFGAICRGCGEYRTEKVSPRFS
ncbi:MAG: SPASM domain-containing protein [Candidatus Omnitrophica bacterium]|nr:SPASM domain-containing protein [Candidatus Omnitrophota bacterium]